MWGPGPTSWGLRWQRRAFCTYVYALCWWMLIWVWPLNQAEGHRVLGYLHMLPGSNPVSGVEGLSNCKVFIPPHKRQLSWVVKVSTLCHYSTLATIKEMNLLFLGLPNELIINFYFFLDMYLLISTESSFSSPICSLNAPLVQLIFFEDKGHSLPVYI